MSKKVNPTAVGIFVAGALVFVVTTIVLLGTGTLFETRERFLIYFQTAANGLTESSDVRLGGVKVGSVRSIQVQLDPTTNVQLIPVVIELSANRLATLTGETLQKKDEIFTDENIQQSINQGLRARLTQISVLTGQLIVELDFIPGDKSGFTFDGDPIAPYPQIPSVKGQIEQVFEKLAQSLEDISKIDIAGLVADTDRMVNNLDAKISDLDLKGISDNANSALKSIDTVAKDQNIKEAIAGFNDAMTELKAILAAVDKQDIRTTLDKAAATMTKAEAAADNIATITSPDAALGIRINSVLAEVEQTSRSIRELMDYLRRNPNSIITGKRQP